MPKDCASTTRRALFRENGNKPLRVRFNRIVRSNTVPSKYIKLVVGEVIKSKVGNSNSSDDEKSYQETLGTLLRQQSMFRSIRDGKCKRSQKRLQCDNFKIPSPPYPKCRAGGVTVPPLPKHLLKMAQTLTRKSFQRSFSGIMLLRLLPLLGVLANKKMKMKSH